MGTRWGSWQLAEELIPRDEGAEIHPFRSWDVIRAIHDKLRMLERGPLHTGGFPTPSIRHWIVSPDRGEREARSARPSGTDVEAFQIKDLEIQRICNEQQFGSGDRHYLGVQFMLWDGQLVITMLITVTVLHETLRIEVTGHALGPVHSLFTTKPEPKTKEVAKAVKFWETEEKKLPLIEPDEVVRLAVRAPVHLVPAAPGLPRRQADPARAVRTAARLGGQAVAAPLHGGRRAARGHPGAARGARGGDQGA